MVPDQDDEAHEANILKKHMSRHDLDGNLFGWAYPSTLPAGTGTSVIVFHKDLVLGYSHRGDIGDNVRNILCHLENTL